MVNKSSNESKWQFIAQVFKLTHTLTPTRTHPHTHILSHMNTHTHTHTHASTHSNIIYIIFNINIILECVLGDNGYSGQTAETGGGKSSSVTVTHTERRGNGG